MLVTIEAWRIHDSSKSSLNTIEEYNSDNLLIHSSFVKKIVTFNVNDYLAVKKFKLAKSGLLVYIVKEIQHRFNSNMPSMFIDFRRFSELGIEEI
jgi:hypothetical protein